MYSDLTSDEEKKVAAMWQILLEYVSLYMRSCESIKVLISQRKLLKALPERFAWKFFLQLMRDYSHAGTLDERTYTACIQEQYRLPHGYVEDEDTEQIKLRKMAWRDVLRHIESSLLSMFPMMATCVGEPPHDQLFLEVNDFEMCI